MTQPAAFVYIDLGGAPRFVGRLWVRERTGRASATFQYSDEWLRYAGRFALDPALAVGEGDYHTMAGQAMFSALGDSAPDRWGRMLIARREAVQARAEGRPARALSELDYLLGVTDHTRQGALRFARTEGGEFVSSDRGGAVPPLVELRRLLGAATRFMEDEETSADLQLLLAPGSSLGGARPKASVRGTDGTLLIAKFPTRHDEYDIVRWEAVAMTLAQRAGIDTAPWKLELVGDKPVLLLSRFDRAGELRIPFVSAMSMLQARDGDARSYPQIADALRLHGARTVEDLRSLWRRMAFNVLISNTDDHLRNHGFLHVGGAGWVLSPAYDLNPTSTEVKPRFLSTAIDGQDFSASFDLALGVANHFGLLESEARAIGREVAESVSTWRRVASGLGIAEPEVRRYEGAFEHKDLTAALT